MTREEAKHTLTILASCLRDGTRFLKEEHEKQFREAYEIAIQALSKPHIVYCKDCKYVTHGRGEKSAKQFGQIYICGKGILISPKALDYCCYGKGRKNERFDK